MEFNELKELGLTEGEIKVYIALLNLGLSTKGFIAKKALVSESKIYEILERLKDKGLVSFVLKKKGKKEVTHFKAANPVILKEFLNKKKKEIENEEKILDNILPSLQARLKSKEKEYSAVIYEGFKGIQANNKEVLEIINKTDEWMAMGVRSDKPKNLNLYWISFLKERAQKGGKARILFVDKGTWYYNQLKKIKNTKIGYLKGISPVAVIVTKNRVMIYNYESHISCLAITNDEVAESFKGFFESLWSLAEK